MKGLHVAILAALALAGAGCHSEEEFAGHACEAVDDCYPDTDPADLSGAIECLAVPGGYCTHLCVTDDDCCAADGECRTDIPEVCSTFQSTDDYKCFLSCEPDVVGDRDPNDYCHEFASADFICRATGGGDPRQVCLPNA